MKLSAEANESLAIRLPKNVLDVPRTSWFCYGCVGVLTIQIKILIFEPMCPYE